MNYLALESRQWDLQAESYDATRRHDPCYQACINAVVRVLHASPGEAILDVGCGTGMVLEHYCRPELRVVGFDLSAASLGVCRRKELIAAWVRGDMLHLPFNDSSFDAVICANALQHLPTEELRRRAIKEFARALKPGGRLVISVHNWSLWKRKMGWTQEGPAQGGTVQFIHRFTATELRGMLAEFLVVQKLFGSGLRLPYWTVRMKLYHLLNHLAVHLPLGLVHGHMLIAVAELQ